MCKKALCNVNYIDVDTGSEYEHWAIVIEDEIIVSVEPMSDFMPQNGITCYDYSGCWVTPGFIDMHTHITQSSDMSEPDYYLSPGKILEISKHNLSELLKSGVTLCRDMGSFAHSAEWVKTCFASEKGLPQMLTCGGILTYNCGHMQTFGTQIQSDLEIEAAVNENVSVGCDFIKITSDPCDTEARCQNPNPAFNEKTVRLITEEAAKYKLSVACHTYPSEDGVMRALVGGVRTIEHAVAFNEKFGKSRFPNSYYVPTLATAIDVCGINSLSTLKCNENLELFASFCDMQGNDKYTGTPPDSIIEWLDILASNLPFNITSEQNICIGSDAGCKGTNFCTALREMLMLSAFGATNRQVLTFAITNACKALSLDNRGRIEKGFIADLIIFESNPLENILAITKNKAVVCRGTIIKN